VKVTREWQVGMAIAVLATETFTNRWKDSEKGEGVFLILCGADRSAYPGQPKNQH
jgi:hypothetical protein